MSSTKDYVSSFSFLLTLNMLCISVILKICKRINNIANKEFYSVSYSPVV